MSRILTLALCACAALRTAGSAQQLPGRIGAGAAYETFTFDAPERVGIESISLLTVPLAARLSLSRSVAVELSSAWASGRMVRTNGIESTKSGPTDTELRIVVGLGQDVFTITGAALLPTGSEALSPEEADVTGVIAADVLPFRISNWGTGGGAGINAAFARPLGEFAVGLSVGYVLAREFEPLTGDQATYRPGNQLSVRAAIDRTFGTAGKAALVVSMQRYAEDQVDGNNQFQPGTRYEGVASYAFAAGATGAAILYAGIQHRDAGEFAASTFVLPAQDLVLLGGGLETRAGQVLIRPNADVRMLRRDNGTDQGYTASAGADLELPAGRFTFVPGLRGRFGNVAVQEGVESGLLGIDLALTVRFGAR